MDPLSLLQTELDRSRRMLADGGVAEIVPRWRIGIADGTEIDLVTRFDHNRSGDAERVLRLVNGVLRWKGGRWFVVSGETFLGAAQTEEAVFAIFGSPSDACGLLRPFRRSGGQVTFGDVVELDSGQVDPAYLAVLHDLDVPVSDGEVAVLRQMVSAGKAGR